MQKRAYLLFKVIMDGIQKVNLEKHEVNVRKATTLQYKRKRCVRFLYWHLHPIFCLIHPLCVVEIRGK